MAVLQGNEGVGAVIKVVKVSEDAYPYHSKSQSGNSALPCLGLDIGFLASHMRPLL